jgi:hypothetical protein
MRHVRPHVLTARVPPIALCVPRSATNGDTLLACTSRCPLCREVGYKGRYVTFAPLAKMGAHSRHIPLFSRSASRLDARHIPVFSRSASHLDARYALDSAADPMPLLAAISRRIRAACAILVSCFGMISICEERSPPDLCKREYTNHRSALQRQAVQNSMMAGSAGVPAAQAASGNAARPQAATSKVLEHAILPQIDSFLAWGDDD